MFLPLLNSFRWWSGYRKKAIGNCVTAEYYFLQNQAERGCSYGYFHTQSRSTERRKHKRFRLPLSILPGLLRRIETCVHKVHILTMHATSGTYTWCLGGGKSHVSLTLFFKNLPTSKSQQRSVHMTLLQQVSVCEGGAWSWGGIPTTLQQSWCHGQAPGAFFSYLGVCTKTKCAPIPKWSYFEDGRGPEGAAGLPDPPGGQRKPPCKRKSPSVSVMLQLLQHHWETQYWATLLKGEWCSFCSQ